MDDGLAHGEEMANKECPLCGADPACLRWSGVQVLRGRPCLVLEPARAFAFGQGVRAPAIGGRGMPSGPQSVLAQCFFCPIFCRCSCGHVDLMQFNVDLMQLNADLLQFHVDLMQFNANLLHM